MARIGYARVSSLDQDLEGQLGRLKQEGCSIIRSEKVSGATREYRPELAIVLQFLRSGDELPKAGIRADAAALIAGAAGGWRTRAVIAAGMGCSRMQIYRVLAGRH